MKCRIVFTEFSQSFRDGFLLFSHRFGLITNSLHQLVSALSDAPKKDQNYGRRLDAHINGGLPTRILLLHPTILSTPYLFIPLSSTPLSTYHNRNSSKPSNHILQKTKYKKNQNHSTDVIVKDFVVEELQELLQIRCYLKLLPTKIQG